MSASSSVPLSGAQTAGPTGFEGCEKKLVIQFTPTKDLRTISRQDWDHILLQAKCEIISKTSNANFDAYVLSESSLFVYATEIMIKTCGTTALLHAIPSILRVTSDLGVSPVYVQFSRSNFLFPEHQPFPHRTFNMEVAYLNTFFECGKAHILGPLNGPRWHIYIANIKPRVARDQTLEVIMFDLDPEAMIRYYKQAPPGVTVTLPRDGPEATTTTGIDTLLPGSVIDSFLFEPCGYSCNGLWDKAYFTIHVTPEPHCSFVSFETNARLPDYTELVQKVLDIFKPGTWSAAVCARTNAGISSPTVGLTWSFDGHVVQNRTTHEFEHGDNVRVGHFVSETAAKMAAEQKTKATLDRASSLRRLGEQLYDDQHLHVLPYQLTRMLGPEQLRNHVEPLLRSQVELLSPTDGSSLQDIIEQHISSADPEGCFVVTDLDAVLNAYSAWSTEFPEIEPCLTVKSNADTAVLTALGSLGCRFNAFSVQEARRLLSLGVLPNQITFGNPWKPVSHLQFAAHHKIGFLTVDCLSELHKIHKHYPNANLLLNMVCPKSTGGDPRRSSLPCSPTATPATEVVEKFHGATMGEARSVLAEAAHIGANIVGVSFSDAPVSGRDEDVCRRLKKAASVLQAAVEILGRSLTVVDLGEIKGDLNEVKALANQLKEEMTTHLGPDTDKLTVIARPSRLLVAPSQTLVSRVLGRKDITVFAASDENSQAVNTKLSHSHSTSKLELKIPSSRHELLDDDSDAQSTGDGEVSPKPSVGFAYYVSQVPWLNASGQGLNLKAEPLAVPKLATAYPSAVFGTGDSMGCMCPGARLPQLEPDDWILFSGVGASGATSAVDDDSDAPCYILRVAE